jgi:serine phosphatase RsbU (regulator of sigma subunit)
MAKSIQQQILPNEEPQMPKIKISARYTPMDQLGGDFYDFFLLDNGKNLGFIISDVSGHGSAAAFITAMIKIACKSLPENIFKSPKLFLKEVNKRIIGYTSSNFITAFYCYFDMSNDRLLYGCAGHNHPILIRSDYQIEELYAKGRILGFLEDAIFEEKELYLKKGDRILFYTDGLSESINLKEEMYSQERIVDMIKKTYNLDVNNSMEEIYQDMLRWIKSERRIQDDVAIVMFDYFK